MSRLLLCLRIDAAINNTFPSSPRGKIFSSCICISIPFRQYRIPYSVFIPQFLLLSVKYISIVLFVYILKDGYDSSDATTEGSLPLLHTEGSNFEKNSERVII